VGVLYSIIKDITVNEQDLYIVDYETSEYTEQLPGQHLHFFFNTVPPERAGYPSDALWYVWGGPRPFNGFLVSDRPEFATQMCILVANPDHSVQPNSGNCFLLPDSRQLLMQRDTQPYFVTPSPTICANPADES
jgi:hypothetical protein